MTKKKKSEPFLKLQRPLVFLDLETTGVSVETDQIIEIAVVKVQPNGALEDKVRRCRPEKLIPIAASKTHSITDEMVANEPPFAKLAPGLLKYIEGCDFAGYNIRKFDLPLLKAEFKRAGIEWDYSSAKIVDVMGIYHKQEPQTLSKAYEFYNGRKMEDAHSALADTAACVEILSAQIGKYGLENSVDALAVESLNRDPNAIDDDSRFVWDAEGNCCINFGKHKGMTLAKLLATQSGFLRWMLEQDFSIDVKQIAHEALFQGFIPTKES